MITWIKVKKLDGSEIIVAQRRSFGDLFVDKDGNTYKASHLDFTQAAFELPSYDEEVAKQKEESLKNIEAMNEIIKSFDVTKQDDHRALITEREYWRKLRGDIFLELLRNTDIKDYSVEQLAAATYNAFYALYEQDSKFFADKKMFNVPVV